MDNLVFSKSWVLNGIKKMNFLINLIYTMLNEACFNTSKILMLRCVTIDIALKLANMKVMFLDFFYHLEYTFENCTDSLETFSHQNFFFISFFLVFCFYYFFFFHLLFSMEFTNLNFSLNQQCNKYLTEFMRQNGIFMNVVLTSRSDIADC